MSPVFFWNTFLLQQSPLQTVTLVRSNLQIPPPKIHMRLAAFAALAVVGGLSVGFVLRGPVSQDAQVRSSPAIRWVEPKDAELFSSPLSMSTIESLAASATQFSTPMDCSKPNTCDAAPHAAFYLRACLGLCHAFASGVPCARACSSPHPSSTKTS